MNEDRRRPRAIDLPHEEMPGPRGTPSPEPDAAETVPVGFGTHGEATVNSPAAIPTSVRMPRAVEVEAIRFEDDVFAADTAVEPADELPRRRGAGLLALAGSAALALLGIAVGLWVESLVARLFEMAPWAGLVGLALAVLLVGSLLALALRELAAIRRLASRTALRERGARAVLANDDGEARRIVSDLVGLLSDRPETARGRGELSAVSRDVMDARDRLALAERALLAPLDERAQAVVLTSAKRVSVVTAVAPRALIDIAFVLLQNARTVRAVAAIYGLRPGRLGFLRLMRDVLGHLAVTGTIAVGDSVLGEALGHGLASRLSSRFGEGIVNGLLTARVGIAAMDLCRPLPFEAVERPTIAALASSLIRSLGPSRR